MVPLEENLREKSLLVLEKLKSPTFLTPRETSTETLKLWKAVCDEIINRPVTGVGIQVFDNIRAKKNLFEGGCNSHNLILNILVELGIPCLLLFLIFIYSLLKRADLFRPIIGIPLIVVFAGQMVDFFIYDFTFTSIGFYFLDEAGNSKHENN
jgi:hypothetical protein